MNILFEIKVYLLPHNPLGQLVPPPTRVRVLKLELLRPVLHVGVNLVDDFFAGKAEFSVRPDGLIVEHDRAVHAEVVLVLLDVFPCRFFVYKFCNTSGKYHIKNIHVICYISNTIQISMLKLKVDCFYNTDIV